MKINIDDVDYVTETSITIRGSRRRTTVPKYVVDTLNIKDGDKLRWLLFKDNTIIISKIDRER